MGKMFCHECGNKVDDSATFCPKCGTKLESPDEDNSNVYCENCGEKLTNGVCNNCSVSSSKSSISLYIIIIGYILASLSGFRLLGIFGMIFGIYLVYKGHKDLLKRKLNKTNVNGIVICVWSIVGFLTLAVDILFFSMTFIIFIVVNVALKTDRNEYYDLNGNTKYGLLILGIVLGLFLILSISSAISHEIYEHNIGSYMNDTSYLEEGYYERNINGVVFHIPNSYKENDSASNSDSEIVRFVGKDKYDKFTIYVSDAGFPNHAGELRSSQGTYNGVNGEYKFYTTETVKGKITSATNYFDYQMGGKSVEIDISHIKNDLLNVIIVN